MHRASWADRLLPPRKRRASACRSWRAALAETLKDPALLADAQKQSLPIELFSAEESEKIVNTVYSASPELVRRFKAVYD